MKKKQKAETEEQQAVTRDPESREKKPFTLREVVTMTKDVTEAAKTGIKTMETFKKCIVPVLVVGFAAAAYVLTGEKLSDKQQER